MLLLPICELLRSRDSRVGGKCKRMVLTCSSLSGAKSEMQPKFSMTRESFTAG